MSFTKAKEILQEVKEIKQLKNTTEYEINAKEIEEQDLQKHKELYNEMCRIHDEKKQEMIELKEIRKQSKQNNERLKLGLKTITKKVEDQRAIMPPTPRMEVEVSRFEKTKSEVDARLKLMEDKLHEEFMDEVESIFTTKTMMIKMKEGQVGIFKRRGRANSLPERWSGLIADKKLNDLRNKNMEFQLDGCYEKFVEMHKKKKEKEKKKAERKTKRRPLMMTLRNSEVNTSMILAQQTRSNDSVIPEFKPTSFGRCKIDAKTLGGKQTLMWGYVPVHRVNTDDYLGKIDSDKFTFIEGHRKTGVIFNPNAPWNCYLKNALHFYTKEPTYGHVLLSIQIMDKKSEHPPNYRDVNGMVLCVLKSHFGERRGMFELCEVKKEDGKEGIKFQHVKIAKKLLEDFSTNVKFKQIDLSGKTNVLKQFDEILYPKQYNAFVRYVNTDNDECILDDTQYCPAFDTFMSSFSSAIGTHEDTGFKDITSLCKCTNYVFYQQNEWCEFCYYASPLMGKDDRSAFHTNVFSRITILFVEGRKPLKIEQACKSILCIVAREDPNGYEITVAQEKQRLEEYENGGRVIFELPAEGFVVPSYQMRYFMAALMVECNRAAKFSKSSFEEAKQKMNSLLEKLKPAK